MALRVGAPDRCGKQATPLRHAPDQGLPGDGAQDRLDYTATCAGRLLPAGIFVELAWYGEELKAHLFDTEGEALAWAEEERQALMANRWTEITTPPASVSARAQ